MMLSLLNSTLLIHTRKSCTERLLETAHISTTTTLRTTKFMQMRSAAYLGIYIKYKKSYLTSDEFQGKDGVPLSSMLHHSDLINGRGQYNDNQAPLAWFNVTSWDQEYLGFYIMNPGVEYSYNVSIDNHKMEIIGVGVEEVKPKLVDAVYINPGNQ